MQRNTGVALVALVAAAMAQQALAQKLATSDDFSVNTQYRQAVADARSDRVQPAVVVLGSLVESHPQRGDILNDYVVVLGWAGQDGRALELLDRVDRPNAPAYVLESAAGSARRTQNYQLAATLYAEEAARFPDRAEAQIGLGRSLLDAGKADAAAPIADAMRTRFPKRIDALELHADVATARRDYFGALADYQAILAIEPANRTAQRGKVLTLSRLGTPELAAKAADENPGLFTRAERDAIGADIVAREVRSGAIAAANGRGPARFEAIDKALAHSDAAGARAMDPNAQLTPAERQLALDRIGALRERYRMGDAVALYQALAARPQPMPAYAKADAASAYLYLEQPRQARDLYRESLIDDPNNLRSQIGLFYALAENGEHREALAQAERTVAAHPPTTGSWSPPTTVPNPDYVDALTARSMAPLLAGNPKDAEQRLRALSESAPGNLDVRTDHASAMRARGWPRAAEEELRGVISADPNNSGALGERAGALLEMRDYRAAEAALAVARDTAAEDGRVRRAARLARVHNMGELIIDGTVGKSSGGGPNGSRDYTLESYLYSAPLSYNYRAFLHGYSAEATFDTGTGRRQRLGGGLEYRSSLIIASAELAQGINDHKTAGAVSLAITPNDHWTLRGGYQSSANQTPLQASLAGIDAHRVFAEVDWRASESRDAGLAVEHFDFSDGNRRDAARTHWTERVVSGPVYRLAITGALYTSRNSRAGAPYFNPSRDFSPTVELANEWVQWQRYTRSFRHRLVLEGGTYQQQNFGTKPVAQVRYEQQWEADDRLTVRYGIGRSQHPYDGVKTTRDFAYLYLTWRF